MHLAKVEDYVTLTDRNSQANYIVERDGAIWKSPEFPEAYFIPDRRKPVILNWRDYVSGPVTWKWRNGYLPVLEISDEQNLLELTADGDELLMRKNRNEVYAVEGMKSVSPDKFDALIQGSEKYWNTFFEQSWQPPEDGIFPDCVWRACLVQAINAFCGLHPKYGSCYYSRNYHDGFPPTIISMVDTLLDYQHYQMALDMLGYYFERFILPDGSIDYYGPALSEYGMILSLSGKILEISNGEEWLRNYLDIFGRIARYLYRLRNRFIYGSDNKYRLLAGVPEADTRDAETIYTQNNAWVWRGLDSWSKVAGRLGFIEASQEASREANDLKNMLTLAIKENLTSDGLPPFRLDFQAAISSYTESRDAAYANFRYYPELLYSGFLSADLAMKIIESREQYDGELAGLTYFHFSAAWSGLNTADFCCNNLQITAYANGLMQLGEYERFMRVLSSHYLYHQTSDTYTAYENVDADIPKNRRAFTDWCVPCQLVYPRLLRWGYQKFGKIEMIR